ncbi:MAG: hypothetical protein ACTSUO_06090 [Candidatus Thorarchaeota archaeon]
MIELIASDKVIEKAKKNIRRVISYETTENSVSGIVYSSKGDKRHSVMIRSDGEISCTCHAGFIGRSACWHSVALLLSIKEDIRKKYVKAVVNKYLQSKPSELSIEYFQTSVDGVNDLVGGLPVGTPLGIVGPYQGGKTILNIQFGFDIIRRKNKSAIFLDTEGNVYSYYGWVERFSKTYDIKPKIYECHPRIVEGGLVMDYPKDVKTPAIIVVDARDIEKILALHGRQCRVVVKESKFGLEPVEKGWSKTIEETPMAKLIEKTDAGYLSYDSITTPLNEFGIERQNFPVRASATNYWTIQMEKLAERYWIPVVGVVHDTLNPTNQFDRPKHKGGKSIGHFFKFLIYLQKGRSTHTPKTEKRPQDVREMWVLRHPYKAPWDEYKLLRITDGGWRDY